MSRMKCIKQRRGIVWITVVTSLTAFSAVAIGTVSIEAIAQAFFYEAPAESTTLGLLLAGLVLGLLAGVLFMRCRQLYAVLSCALFTACIATLLLVGMHISSLFNQVCVAIISCLCAFSILLACGLIKQESMAGNQRADIKMFLLSVVSGILCGFVVPYLFARSIVTSVCFVALVVAFFIVLFPLPDASSNVARY